MATNQQRDISLPHHVKQRSGSGGCMLGEVSHHGLPVHCCAHSVSLSARMWPTPAGVASAKAAPYALYPVNSAPSSVPTPFGYGANLATRFLPPDPVRSCRDLS
ncbi:hypothetical protein B296_00007156 [Ensete ventricosum]|uniref:Uncharacterized protein n=1 Tax=Ensete ventricosum TaxID=4639 RepID=A0A427B204_ENSVE|nr:hypothetical protein B296_00007156 [Ensete ventricosum]